MSKYANHWVGVILLMAGFGVLAPQAARAEAAEDCGPWKLFPDFRCEGREARPEGAFNPVGMPYLFEDPYITTGLNFAYIYHRLPDKGSLGLAFGGARWAAITIDCREPGRSRTYTVERSGSSTVARFFFGDSPACQRPNWLSSNGRISSRRVSPTTTRVARLGSNQSRWNTRSSLGVAVDTTASVPVPVTGTP